MFADTTGQLCWSLWWCQLLTVSALLEPVVVSAIDCIRHSWTALLEPVVVSAIDCIRHSWTALLEPVVVSAIDCIRAAVSWDC